MLRQAIKLDETRCLIPLTKGLHALVDNVDAEFLTQWNWYAERTYAYRSVGSKPKQKQIPMHTVVFERAGGELPPGYLVDHRDRNPLNNCRANLRAATELQNHANKGLRASNTSGITGVRLDSRGRWEASISYRGDMHIQRFATVEEAVHWRNELGVRFQGEFYVPCVIPEGWVPPPPLVQDTRLDETELARRLLENEILRAHLAKL